MKELICHIFFKDRARQKLKSKSKVVIIFFNMER